MLNAAFKAVTYLEFVIGKSVAKVYWVPLLFCFPFLLQASDYYRNAWPLV